MLEGNQSSDHHYQAQVESVMATLAEELPTLFKKDLSYEFHAQLFFTEIYFDVHDVRQAAKYIIKVDWTVRGTLRLPWKAKIFFNGNSTYKLNQDGLIYSHIDTWDRAPTEVLKQFLPQR
ncbi:MAG: hypothetical protein BRC35_11430 [Cyanobacteria bacterium QH_10_48_56]|nr:MAG: hypothetical protein BRC35_11430 [Cyanobacteria bacterium QH_10_48_56]